MHLSSALALQNQPEVENRKGKSLNLLFSKGKSTGVFQYTQQRPAAQQQGVGFCLKQTKETPHHRNYSSVSS